MRYEITPDSDGENPTEWSEWEMHSFGRRHSNFCHPDKFGISVNQYGEVECNQIGLRAKLDAGTAFSPISPAPLAPKGPSGSGASMISACI